MKYIFKFPEYVSNSLKDRSQTSCIDFSNMSEILIKYFERGEENIQALCFSNILRNIDKIIS